MPVLLRHAVYLLLLPAIRLSFRLAYVAAPYINSFALVQHSILPLSINS
jgi:hypothetical protein